MALDITFLGHQGWAFGSSDSDRVVLLDPVLEDFGRGPRFQIWPTRDVLVEKLPPIDGIVLSHEHSDHFDIPTLQRLPYRGVVHISDLCSRAMDAALVSMGYEVERFRGYEALEFGGVRMTPLPSQYLRTERDVFGFLVVSGEGSFLTTVDSWPHVGTLDWLQEHRPRRTMDNYTNNSICPPAYLSNDQQHSPHLLRDFMRLTCDAFSQFVQTFDPSEAIISGQGWCYAAPLEHLNNLVFPAPPEQLREVVALMYPSLRVRAPNPGDRYRLATTVEPRGEAEYVARTDPPDRMYRPQTQAPARVGPLCGVTAVTSETWATIERFVCQRFGQLLATHGRSLVAGLHQLEGQPDLGVDPAFLLRIRNDDSVHDFRYALGTAEFAPTVVEGNPVEHYVLGCELWASDFWAITQCEADASSVYETSMRRWNHAPSLFSEDITLDLFDGFSPRFMPELHIRAYAREIQAERRRSR